MNSNPKRNITTEARWVVFDVEGDGLTPRKIHCLCWKDFEGKTGDLTSYDDIRRFFDVYDVYVGHNIRRWDIPHCNRLLDITIDNHSKTIIDTLGLSWYLDPTRTKHSLADYAAEQGDQKVKIDDWLGLTTAAYVERCRKDVELNWKLWKNQLQHLTEIYTNKNDLWKFLRYLDFKMKCAHLAEKSRWRLDVERCREAVVRLEAERDQRRAELRAAMPRVPIVRIYTKPKNLHNSNGELSSLGTKWFKRLDEAGLPPEYEGVIRTVVRYDEPNPSSNPQLKEWLYSLGWVPETIKYVRDKATGKIKEIPQINREFGGGVCKSILKLADKEPALNYLDGVSVLSHRIGLLNGFLRDVDDEGYLRAAVQGLTNTLRFKHAEIVNLPKPEKRYAKDIRSCLIADKDEELCGADMTSLEDKLKQHFIFKHDPEYVEKLNLPDYDAHLDLATLVEDLSPGEGITRSDADEYKRVNALLESGQEVSEEEKSIIHRIKPKRGIFKNGNYACQYGAGVSRLAITCGISEEGAKNLHTAYWKLNWAIKAVAAEQTVRSVRGQKYLFNPINRFWYVLRTEKDIFSTLVQGSAVYCFDTWVAHVLAGREQLTGQFHDEIILTVKSGHRDEIREYLAETIRETNEYLNLNRELGIGVQFGINYAEIH